MLKFTTNFFLYCCFVICFIHCNDDFLEIPEIENPSTENPITNPTNTFETYLLGEMAQQNIPALSALVFQDDQIKYQATLGLSNINENLALADNHLWNLK